MFRKFWFQCHWLLGITAGVILAVVGVTGALLSYHDDIVVWLNASVVHVKPGDTPLPPDELLARIAASNPGKTPRSLTLSRNPADSARVVFAPGGAGGSAPGGPPRGGGRGETRYVNPYTGELLPALRGREFFQTVEQLHRRLLLGNFGKQAVGASTVCLLILALSGLYLRWPRRLGDWRDWLTFSFRRRGRAFLWGMHRAVGTWMLLCYLLIGVTGVIMSYNGLRGSLNQLAGISAQRGPGSGQAPALGAVPRAQGANSPLGADAPRIDARSDTTPETRGRAPTLDVAAAWALFQRQVPAYSSATLNLPDRPGPTVQFTYLDPKPRHERASNRISLDVANGAVLQHDRYADRPLGARLMTGMTPLHTGSWFGAPGVILMMLASLAMPLFTLTGWMLYLSRRVQARG